MPRPMTYDRLKSGKKLPTRKVIVPLDDEVAAEWQEAEGRLSLVKMRLEMGIENDDLKKTLVEEAAEAQAKVDEIKGSMEENVAVFVLRGLGRKKFDKLQNTPEYLPTDEQIRIAKERNGPNATLDWNPDTFPPVLLAKSLIEPELTEEQALELWNSDEWTQAELLNLLQNALELNTQIRNINWGKG